MIEADLSGCQKEYILKLQFQLSLADYFGLCDVADSQNPSKDGRFVGLCPKFSFNMRVDSV
jgi:hypothetical protein